MTKELEEAFGLVKRTCELYIDSMKQRDLIGCNIVGSQINETLNTIQNHLEPIDNAKPSEALECLRTIEEYDIYNTNCDTMKDCCNYELNVIKQTLLKARDMEEETYVIYCVNNFHNVYMDYRGEHCHYQDATIFNNKFEAHKFLREKGTDNYYRWSVFNIKDLREDQKHWQD